MLSDSSSSGQKPVTGYCEHVNVLSGFIKAEYLGRLLGYRLVINDSAPWTVELTIHLNLVSRPPYVPNHNGVTVRHRGSHFIKHYTIIIQFS
jgi:hypothetical protein